SCRPTRPPCSTAGGPAGWSMDRAAHTCRRSRAARRGYSTCCRRAQSSSPKRENPGRRGRERPWNPRRRRTMPSLSTADHRLTPPQVTIPRDYNAAHDLIERNLAAGRGSKVAYIDDGGSYSYGELAERVTRCASALVQLGIAREERVLLCLLDTIDFPSAFLGAIKAGIVPVAGNTVLTARDYEY